jgi:hypothetical protein
MLFQAQVSILSTYIKIISPYIVTLRNESEASSPYDKGVHQK